MTINSHRGIGEQRYGGGDDLSVATGATNDGSVSASVTQSEGGVCPAFLTDFSEEIWGTLSDTKMSFHQVFHAFVLGPDDIDRVADQIQNSGLELMYTYEKQQLTADEGGKEAGTGSGKSTVPSKKTMSV